MHAPVGKESVKKVKNFTDEFSAGGSNHPDGYNDESLESLILRVYHSYPMKLSSSADERSVYYSMESELKSRTSPKQMARWRRIQQNPKFPRLEMDNEEVLQIVLEGDLCTIIREALDMGGRWKSLPFDQKIEEMKNIPDLTNEILETAKAEGLISERAERVTVNVAGNILREVFTAIWPVRIARAEIDAEPELAALDRRALLTDEHTKMVLTKFPRYAYPIYLSPAVFKGFRDFVKSTAPFIPKGQINPIDRLNFKNGILDIKKMEFYDSNDTCVQP